MSLDDSLNSVPTVIPARMINEYVYCPRFFHLAYVGREEGENDFTVEGKWLHRRVDRGGRRGGGRTGGGLGSAGLEVRSLELTSERLGMSAKVDVVRSEGDVATPIEYKRGASKPGDHPVWLPERVQLAVAGLLLRERGYRCDHGVVYFTGSQERVEVEFTDEFVGIVLRSVAEMRRVAADPVPPEPLEDSPKCPACIYVGICLPDEKQLLRGRRSSPPRRLLPADPAAAPMYVTTPGARVGRDGDRIVVTQGGERIADRRLIDVSQLVVYGNVSVSTPLLRELQSRDVPISYFSSGGWFSGITTGLPSKNVEIRRRQALLSDEVQVEIARRMVEAKVLNSRTLLRRNGSPRDDRALKELKRLAVRVGKASDAESLLGLEGAAAALYFSRFSRMLKRGDDFDFTRRNRRPPVDPVNALLSFTYGLLARELTAVSLSVGLDPYLGVFHRPRFGRPALALDLAEEFRPLVADSVVIGLINNGEVRRSHFVEADGAVSLTQQGRRTVLKAYERRVTTEFTHPVFKYKVSYRRAMEIQARILAAVLLGEFDQYTGVVTR